MRLIHINAVTPKITITAISETTIITFDCVGWPVVAFELDKISELVELLLGGSVGNIVGCEIGRLVGIVVGCTDGGMVGEAVVVNLVICIVVGIIVGTNVGLNDGFA
jgi:hypothetical protein